MTEEKKLGIYKKILKVMQNVKYIPKDGDIEFGKIKYKFLSAEEIVKNIRKEMIAQKLVMFPFKTEVTNQSGNEKDILVTYALVDTEDGSAIDIQVAGGGCDSSDKKTYKAMTGAYKYALRQTFMIETGDDDPDKDPSEKNKTSNKTKNGKTITPDNKNIDDLLNLAFISEKTRKAFVDSFKGTEESMIKTLEKRIEKEIK